MPVKSMSKLVMLIRRLILILLIYLGGICAKIAWLKIVSEPHIGMSKLEYDLSSYDTATRDEILTKVDSQFGGEVICIFVKEGEGGNLFLIDSKGSLFLPRKRVIYSIRRISTESGLKIR